MSQLSCRTVTTPIGPLRLAGGEAGLCRIAFPAESRHAWEAWFQRHRGGLPSLEGDGLLEEAAHQIEAYFRGRLRRFSLLLDLSGTDFQRRVWGALREIPFGGTSSYSDVARRIGRQGASRAVGRAVASNPIPIVIPCHRVLGRDGSLVGFGGGLEAKRALLELERTRGAGPTGRRDR